MSIFNNNITNHNLLFYPKFSSKHLSEIRIPHQWILHNELDKVFRFNPNWHPSVVNVAYHWWTPSTISAFMNAVLSQIIILNKKTANIMTFFHFTGLAYRGIKILSEYYIGHAQICFHVLVLYWLNVVQS